MVNIPPHMIKRMKTMSPEQRKEVIAYFKRNDEEEVRLAARKQQKTPVDKLNEKVAPIEPAAAPKKPPASPNEYIKRADPVGDYVEEIYTEAMKPTEESPVAQVLRVEANMRSLEREDLERLKEWANSVAEIESNNIPDRKQGDSETGIGRGKYQFEIKKEVDGKTVGSGSAITAAQRLKNWEEKNGKLNIPEEDRKELAKDIPDFSKLTEPTQDAIFFIHHSLKENVPLTAIAKGEYDPKEAWLNFHWAGDKEDRLAKSLMWDARISDSYLSKAANVAKTFIGALT